MRVTVLRIGPEEEYMGNCSDCGEYQELRPYGPDGEKVCFACASKDPETMADQFFNHLEENSFDLDDDLFD